ncbi:MAG: hypothetical protein ACR2KC_00570 [Acidimicrobiales bacterium]
MPRRGESQVLRRERPRLLLSAICAVIALLAGLAQGSSPKAVPLNPRPAVASISPGYWMAASDGGVYQFNTPNLGGLRGMHLNAPVVGMAAAPDGEGYWMAAADGGVFNFADAPFLGSAGNLRLNRPIVGMAATADGRGYWLVASDGGIFNYGDAPFLGSTGNLRLNRPVVGMAATADGRGYWLVASDGGIFNYGDAPFLGSTGNMRLNQPIVGMAAGRAGGYWLAASERGIFKFSAPFLCSTGNTKLKQPVVAVGAGPDEGGYWLFARDGGLFNFGDAPFLGSAASQSSPAPVVSVATTIHGYPYPPGSTGYDISWPDCGHALPPGGSPVSIVGVNGGLIDNLNPCFASEAAGWAGANLTVYINVNLVPDGNPSRAMNGPAGACAQGDIVCQGYNWGWNNAAVDLGFVHSNGFAPRVWWLDVEQPCGYSPSPLWRCGSSQALQSNVNVIRGAVDAIHSASLTAGIYSTYLQWPATVGPDFQEPGIPIWIATVPNDQADWAADCSKPNLRFAGGVPWLIQWLGGASPTGYDQDLACLH